MDNLCGPDCFCGLAGHRGDHAPARRRQEQQGRQAGQHLSDLGATDAERQKNFQIFKAWTGEDAWIHKRWGKKGEMPGVTKEALSKMKLKY